MKTGHVMREVGLTTRIHCAVPLWFLLGDERDDVKPVTLPKIIRRAFSCAAGHGLSYNCLQGHLRSILPNVDDCEEETSFRMANRLPSRLRTAAVALPIAPAAV